MRNILCLMAFAALTLFMGLSGCGKIDGPRFWWDDRNQERLPEYYSLPSDPAAPADYVGYEEEPALASGEDLSEDNLRDFHMDLDQEEEKRKSESSLLDF